MRFSEIVCIQSTAQFLKKYLYIDVSKALTKKALVKQKNRLFIDKLHGKRGSDHHRQWYHSA